MLVGSPMGGMNIEDVAATQPEQIFTEPVDVNVGVTDEALERMAKNLGFTEDAQAGAAQQLKKLYELFLATDATQVEINPLIENENNQCMCLDAKLNFDDNASYRQQQVWGLRDQSQEDSREVAASEFDINYIGLDGDIACMVNGAGLAMATMDIIKLKGGSPANFLDLGGGASERTVTEAFKIINADPKVNAILINIFGGIMRCDVIAAGVVNAAKAVGLEKPLIIRLEGTNVKEGKRLIDEASGLHAVILYSCALSLGRSRL
jgi:succinyl-CoA synthetase beta subunit